MRRWSQVGRSQRHGQRVLVGVKEGPVHTKSTGCDSGHFGAFSLLKRGILLPAPLKHVNTSVVMCLLCPTSSGVFVWFVQDIAVACSCYWTGASFPGPWNASLFYGCGPWKSTLWCFAWFWVFAALIPFRGRCIDRVRFIAAPLLIFFCKSVLDVYHCDFLAPSHVQTARAQYVWLPRSMCWHFVCGLKHLFRPWPFFDLQFALLLPSWESSRWVSCHCRGGIV